MSVELKLDLDIKIDPTSQLPLLSEQSKIHELISSYLHLPYSAVEYGCGKRCSIIIKQLTKIGISPHAIKRGMIIEKDLSAEMLKEQDPEKREHALVAKNPLHGLIDFKDQALLEKIRETGAEIDLENRLIKIKQYSLSNQKEVDFSLARSHIFTLISFWDKEKQEITELVEDPSLNIKHMFPAHELRAMLSSPEAAIFIARLSDKFTLSEHHLTASQQEEYRELTKQSLVDADLIRVFLNHPPMLSIGDPETWTYANNIDGFYKPNPSVADKKHLAIQEKITELDLSEQEQMLNDLITKDAIWSEKQLAPLTKLVNTVTKHHALSHLSKLLEEKQKLHNCLEDESSLDKLHGLGLRLRERIDTLAELSINPEGIIDARSLNPQFIKAAIGLIKQMNQAKMLVFVDKVANIHGILCSEQDKALFIEGKLSTEELCSKALCYHSHIDTVLDAGKYDGRLGVLSGVEVAHTLSDLRQGSDLNIDKNLSKLPLMVSAFSNEEMSFTGAGVSMPGSSAIAEIASPEQVYKMINAEAELYGDRMLALLEILLEASEKGDIELAHKISECLEDLPEPSNFFPKQMLERHSEQAGSLFKASVPNIHAEAIMGIYQEDYIITGSRSEQAALALVYKLRDIQENDNKFREMRVTNGVLEHLVRPEQASELSFAENYSIQGARNHAGATSLENRFDPFVAAAKLCNYFYELCREESLEPRIGSIELSPGLSRNVIAESMKLCLAVQPGKCSQEQWQNLKIKMRSLLFDLIDKDLLSWQNSPKAEMSFSSKLRLSLDLRFAQEQDKLEYLNAIKKVFDEISEEYKVDIERSVEQELDAVRLDEAKYASLMMDQSIGGSHNPNEAQHNKVILIGTILQLIIYFELAQDPERAIYDLVKETIPEEWKNKIGPFCSGALHDTCNLVKGLNKRMKSPC